MKPLTVGFERCGRDEAAASGRGDVAQAATVGELCRELVEREALLPDRVESVFRRCASANLPDRSYPVARKATLYLVTDVRRPGVSPVGIAFSASSPRA